HHPVLISFPTRLSSDLEVNQCDSCPPSCRAGGRPGGEPHRFRHHTTTASRPSTMTHRNRVRLSKLSIGLIAALAAAPVFAQSTSDRKSTRLNSSHVKIS